jgi:hypothetical protein
MRTTKVRAAIAHEGDICLFAPIPIHSSPCAAGTEVILQCLAYVGVPKTLNAFSTVRKIGIIKENQVDQNEAQYESQGSLDTAALMEGIKARYDRYAAIAG